MVVLNFARSARSLSSRSWRSCWVVLGPDEEGGPGAIQEGVDAAASVKKVVCALRDPKSRPMTRTGSSRSSAKYFLLWSPEEGGAAERAYQGAASLFNPTPCPKPNPSSNLGSLVQVFGSPLFFTSRRCASFASSGRGSPAGGASSSLSWWCGRPGGGGPAPPSRRRRRRYSRSACCEDENKVVFVGLNQNH